AANPVFYGAAPHTVVPGQKLGGAPLADGYVVAPKGKTTDVAVDVFSTAPLPAPLTVLATRTRYGGGSTFDPYAATQVAKGVTRGAPGTTRTLRRFAMRRRAAMSIKIRTSIRRTIIRCRSSHIAAACSSRRPRS